MLVGLGYRNRNCVQDMDLVGPVGRECSTNIFRMSVTQEPSTLQGPEEKDPSHKLGKQLQGWRAWNSRWRLCLQRPTQETLGIDGS